MGKINHPPLEQGATDANRHAGRDTKQRQEPKKAGQNRRPGTLRFLAHARQDCKTGIAARIENIFADIEKTNGAHSNCWNGAGLRPTQSGISPDRRARKSGAGVFGAPSNTPGGIAYAARSMVSLRFVSPLRHSGCKSSDARNLSRHPFSNASSAHISGRRHA